MSRRLILLRHGQTLHNATRRMQGQLDTELAPSGWEGARLIAEELAGYGITRIYSSDLQRASDTARVVGEKIGVSVTEDARFRETHLGDWQGLAHAEVDEKFPGARAAWRHDPTWTPPGGESRLEVAARTKQAVEEIMADYHQWWDDGVVLIVAHGGALAALTGALLNFPNAMFPALQALGNTRFAVLNARPAYQAGSNDALDEKSIEAPTARFDPSQVHNAQWYLSGWNLGPGSI